MTITKSNTNYLIGLSNTLSKIYESEECAWMDDTIGKANSDLQHLHDLNGFMKDRIEIWMFLPSKMVDGKWVVLEEPDKRDYVYRSREIYEEDVREYNEAKEMCLFDGFELYPSTVRSAITLRVKSNKSFHLIFLVVNGSPRVFGRNFISDICDVGFELTKASKRRLKLIDN